MLIQCTNKGCMQTTNALLDTKTLEVICQECGEPIANVSESMKRTLKSFGQIIRDDSRKAFMMACRNCHANREVVLDQDNNTVCGVCHQPINVHLAMKQAIMEIGQKVNTQVAKPKEEKPKEVKTTKPRKKRVSKKKATRKTV